METYIPINAIYWCILALLFVTTILFVVSIYLIKYQNRLLQKDERVDELTKERDELIEQSLELSETADVLNEYYKYTDSFVRELVGIFRVYDESAVKYMNSHRYAGDDPVIQKVLKESMDFDTNMRKKVSDYNVTVENLFSNLSEESNEQTKG